MRLSEAFFKFTSMSIYASSVWLFFVKRGGAELPNREALTEYMIALADVQAA